MYPVNPLTLAVLSFSTFVFGIGFTAPASRARHVGLIFLAGYVAAIILAPNQPRWFNHQIYANLAGGTTLNIMLRYIDIALLQRWSYDTQGPATFATKSHTVNQKKEEKVKRPSGTFFSRLKFGLELLFNKRQTGTPWQVKNVPPFDRRNPAWVPSRTEFLIKNSIRTATCLLMLDAVGLAGQDTSQNRVTFAEKFIPLLARLSEVTVEEITVRIMTSILTALCTYLLFQALYSGSAVIMVGLGLNEPASWRPLFGDFTEITSLRSTWNRFWHQAMGSDLTGPSRYVVSNILRLPRGSPFRRYVYIMLVFQLSGLVHIVGDMAARNDITNAGVMQWFSIQALGFMIEDCGAGLWSTVTGRRDDEGKLWQKILGFCWVMTWMVWTMPVWTYPISRESQGEGILPFSILQKLLVKN